MKRLIPIAFLVLVLGTVGVATGAGPALDRSTTDKIDAALAARLASARADEMIEAIVVLRKQAALPGTRRGDRRREHIRAVIGALRAAAAGTQQPLLALLAQRKAQGKVARVEPLWIFNGLIVTAQPEVLKELAGRPLVQEVRLSESVAAPPPMTSPPASPEANVSVVNGPALWDLGYRGQGIVVANVDTGVDFTHPDLAGQWRGGSNSWFDPNGEHPTTPTDVNGHGTWTMGVIVGGDRGGTKIGVAPAAKWIAVKIFNDRGTATTAGIHRGLQWLIDPDDNPDTADAPDVVNNSWGLNTTGCNLEFQADLRALRAAWIVPVFSAGNGGPVAAANFSPANNPEALSVGATDDSDVLQSWSSRGPSRCDGGIFPDVVAPGLGIQTTDLYGYYTSQTGTSMAAPHVTGVLALLLSAFPDLSAERQEAALESTSVDFDPPGPDNSFGYGRSDALAAYQWAATAPDFTVSATPSSVSTPAGGTAGYTVTVGSANGFAGNVSLSLSGLSAAQASWSFAPPTVAGANGTSQLTINTSSTLAPGTYQLTIAGTDGTTTHRSSVSLVVPAPPDFSLSASPSSASTLPGGSASFTVTVGSLNGFAGDVALSLAGIPSPPASWSFSPSTVAGGAGTSQLTVSTAASTSPGSYTLTITGTSDGTTHTATVTLVVTAPADFTVSASPASAGTGPGGTVNYAITVGSVNGFAGNVSLSLSGLQSGQASWTFTPGTVSGGAGTSSLSVTASSTLAAGTYPLTIRGTSGALSHTATVNLVVSAAPDFGVSLSPSTLTVIAGQQGSYTVSVSSQGGFTGSVSLSVSGLPAFATGSFSRNPVPPPGTSTLTVRTQRFTTKGTFTIKVTGKSGTLTRQATATLIVQ